MRFSSFLLAFLALQVILCNAEVSLTRPNVLLIVVDDLRDLGGLNAVTPALDALSARSTVFRKAYVQQALCAPSRNSFLTSRYRVKNRVGPNLPLSSKQKFRFSMTEAHVLKRNLRFGVNERFGPT